MAHAQRVTEGENLLAVRKNGAEHALSSDLSLPQSWLALLANPAPDGGRPLCPLRGHFPAPRGITLVRGGKELLLILEYAFLTSDLCILNSDR